MQYLFFFIVTMLEASFSYTPGITPLVELILNMDNKQIAHKLQLNGSIHHKLT